jgi:TIR domain-containing protein
MSKLLSQKDLDQLLKTQIKRKGKSVIRDVRGKFRPPSLSTKATNIFLSHSHLDKTIVDKILSLFSDLDVQLYIDWMDESLPGYTNRHTALLIKEKIADSQKFLFLATYNALRSKWCNWELGLAYSSKGENDFAILPIESKSGRWVGNEYLLLYPEMQVDFLSVTGPVRGEDVKINYPNEKSLNLKEWLAQN